ncbi:MAG TPA: 4a-hydroxytetrahydrobiopterin dehydratase [Burkholderiaceae bacterium]|nr:4a-hydroxytetrahydrobiopterin dehydratase [Burkholderiaceae bacterium]
MSTRFLNAHCIHQSGSPLDNATIERNLAELPEWTWDGARNALVRTYRFANYYETIAFINALAWVIHREDHHPDLVVGYNRCEVAFSTHSVKGLSDNDFICAAKANAVYAQGRA